MVIHTAIKKEDCFACIQSRQGTPMCAALKVMDCKECKFYKTKEQLDAEFEKNAARLQKRGTENDKL